MATRSSRGRPAPEGVRTLAVESRPQVDFRPWVPPVLVRLVRRGKSANTQVEKGKRGKGKERGAHSGPVLTTYKAKGALPPVLDVEWNHQSSCKWKPSRAEVIEKMQVFLDRLERHYGQRPIIYTAPDFYEDNLKGAFPNHPFWLRAVAEHPSKVYPGRDWVFWQYSGSGLSQGVNGRIDLNVFHGDESAWWRWLGKVAG